MRIAVIGAGISGNVVARLLAGEHEVHVFEANDYAGGHTNTVRFSLWGREWAVDTGFMVYNDRTYPNFIRLLEWLGVPQQDSDMSFSVRSDRTGLEYQGSSLNGLFAQRRNLLRLDFYRMLRDIVRFNRSAVGLLHGDDDSLTLGAYLQREAYGKEFVEHYLIPMTAAIWSARPRSVLEFPAHFLAAFFHNHGLLQLRGRPQWKTIPGGAAQYVERLLAPLRDRVYLNCPVDRVLRHADHVEVHARGREVESFDAVVLATHADQTLGMLADADDLEREILESFPYQQNEAVLHWDQEVLPTRRRAWASWNYQIMADARKPVSLTYDLSRLQRVESPEPILLTPNPEGRLAEERVIRRMRYTHPAYQTSSVAAQRRHEEINGRRRSYFCGAYWGAGFHEDGLRSALVVARHFGKDLESCIAASIKGASNTYATVP
jgi:predicted NAD/FAD-binding protein